MTTADELLHVDAAGERAIFDDVLADGLDGDLDERIPALRELLESRDAYERLSAARMLVAWDDPVGLEALIGWAREPGRAPYGAVANRFTGQDTTFGHLADALGAGGHSPRSGSSRPARVAAGRALLAIFEDFDFERYLSFALYDDVLRKSLVDEIVAAAERSLRVLESGAELSFDLWTQAAGLLGPLAKESDAEASALAARLIPHGRKYSRMLRELNDSMAAGTGPATWAVLEQLRGSSDPTVRKEAKAAMDRRRRAATH